MRGKIAEIFTSIQGEGIYLGEQQLFVRFFGCNLFCKFCDTRLYSFQEYTPQALFKEIKHYGGAFHSLSFTGGEPLLQKDFLKRILKMTFKEGYRNYLETNGTLPAELEDTIDYIDIVAMDLKLPSSTGMRAFWDVHRDFLQIASRKEVFLKAVINQSTTLEDLEEGLRLIKELSPTSVLVLQPDSDEGYDELHTKLSAFRQVCLDQQVVSCIIPQVHRILGVK